MTILDVIRGDEAIVGKPTLVQKVEEFREDIKTLDEEMDKAALFSEDVLQENDSIYGQTYADLLERWEQWLFSSTPYNFFGSDMFFLRGNMESYKESSSFLDMTFLSGNGQRVQLGTYVFVPAITAGFNIGDYFESQKIMDEETLHRAVRDYIWRGGPVWASLENLTEKTHFILPLIYIETPLFQLHVAEDNPLRKFVEPVQEKGDFFTVCGGQIVVIQPSPGKYRIRFGGIGRRNYRTDAVYDIEVVGTRKKAERRKEDNLSEHRHPSEILLSKYVTTV
jgi:hypothetical protein